MTSLVVTVVRRQLARSVLTSLRLHRQGARDEQWAALILQKYFRMWLAQAQLIRLQMASETQDTQRIAFAQQVRRWCSYSTWSGRL